MGKVVKGLFYLMGLLIGLTIILALAIPLLVDPNDYRNEISEMVEKRTGRTLDIKGDIGLSLFPWIGIEFGEISLSNAKGFDKNAFAEVDRVDIKIKLLPLLRKAVEMDTVILHGMTLNLTKNSSGEDNWSDLAQPSSQTPARPVTSSATNQLPLSSVKEPSPAEMLTAFAINGVEINDARISWDDQSQQQQIVINHLNLVSGAISLDSEFPLEIDFNTTVNSGADTPPMDGAVSLKTLINLNIDKKQYQLNQLQFMSSLKSPQLPGGQLRTEVSGNLSADLLQQKAQAYGLSITLLGMEMILNSDISQLDRAPQLKGDISLKIVQAEPLLTLLGDMLPNTIDHQIIETTAMKSNFSANIESEQVALDEFRLNFDQSSIKGMASVTGFAQPAIHYDFDIDSINIDRYFPTAVDTQTAVETSVASSTARSTGDTPLPIPVGLLRTLDIDGSLRLGALQVLNLHSQKIVTTVKAKGGKLNLAPLSAELYQGRFNGGVNIDVRNKVPTINVDERLTGVEAGPLLKDLLGKDYVTGKVQLTATISTRGDRISQFKKGLNGKAAFRFEDGAIKGIDIAQLIRDAYATYKKQPVVKPVLKPKTDFALLSASVNINDGVVTNNDLSAKSPLLRITGSGQADLGSEKLEYRIMAAVVNTLEGQGGKDGSDLKGLTIPLAVRGTFSDPKFSVELAQMLDEKAKAKINAAKEKARKELAFKEEEARKKLELKKEEARTALEKNKEAARKESQQKLDAEKERLERALQEKLKSKFKLKF